MRVKTCVYCFKELPLSSFHVSSTNKDGLQNGCKDCRSIRRKLAYEKVREKVLAQAQRYRSKHKERRKQYKRHYDRNNRHLANKHAADRRARVRGQSLGQLRKEEIKDIYREASDKGLHVDHIVPLAGKDISGLHVPWNLQLLTPKENFRKSNKWSCE